MKTNVYLVAQWGKQVIELRFYHTQRKRGIRFWLNFKLDFDFGIGKKLENLS